MDEDSGKLCDCGNRFAYSMFDDGTVRYELAAFYTNSGTHIIEWRTVGTWEEFVVAAEAFDNAFHGARH